MHQHAIQTGQGEDIQSGESTQPGTHHSCGCHATAIAIPAGLSRRQFLGAASATALAGIAGCSTGVVNGGAASTSAGGPPMRIDVHHHVAPPAWMAAMKQRNRAEPLLTAWTPRKSLDDMDAAGIATAMLSVTTPGMYLPGMDAVELRKLVRQSNDYAAQLVQQYPGRFGFFAALPMLDTEGSLAEIAYAFDTLKADGIGLITSYGDKWLGDPAFFPIMEELNRRKAVVYTHPTAANCCTNLIPEIPPVMIEFGTDTTRTIASILFSGNARRFGGIRWIFSHAGGTMPMLIERFARHPILVPKAAAEVPDGAVAMLRRFYYDTAQTSNAAAMSALAKVVPVSQIVMGTDYPYRTGLEHVKGLREAGVFTAAEIGAIERDNALALLPRVRR